MKFTTDNFIPRKFELQPSYYRPFGNDYAAVFCLPNGEEYHIELMRWNMFSTKVERVEVIKRMPDCRKVLFTSKTLKGALEEFSKIIKAKEVKQ